MFYKRTHKLVTLLAAIVVLPVAVAQATPIASSTFDTGSEDWRLVSTLGCNEPATWSASGGHPGGFIYGQDPDIGAFGFAAPIKFRGPVMGAYGQTLSFDVAAYQQPDTSQSWVGITGSGYDLIHHYDTPATPYPTWYSQSIVLHENAGWLDAATGFPATHLQMTTVLGDLEGLVIAAEFVEGLNTDISGLDNVVLMPEPGTLGFLALAGLAVVRRRRSA